MGLFRKSKIIDTDEPVATTDSVKKTAERLKSDKAIKERAPKSRTGMKLLRTCVWIFVGFILIKGCMSFVQGTRVVNQTIINGETAPVIEERVKGFAADYASEYFTWNMNNFSERSTRLAAFVSGIDSDAGIKSLDVKGSSRVLTTEVFDAKQLNENQVEVTVMVRREVEIPTEPSSTTPTNNIESTERAVSINKVYMVVPVTVAEEGLVIRSYPRFVTELPKGEATTTSIGPSVSDTNTLALAKELTGSFLSAWYEGNASQLRYFYSIADDAPKSLIKSSFVFDRVESLNMYRIEDQSETMRIQATVILKSDIGESFTNAWSLDVTEKDGRLYVLKSSQETEKNDSAVEEQLTEEPQPNVEETTQVLPEPNNAN
ncbi:conjugal transfer protein (plasmid) [Paenibacillus urinalis]|uniref:Conjugal transfer protein n=1 Tax=Paenibacillus urinalis TaxID=521520 RepID=A0AAX3N6L4_9BACL|nr:MULTISPECIES: conjugal transfer protein [Paenibacillus]MCM3130520.1 conjugal transfer protein [Paenibacillus sp. MER 78]WDH85406.1 conjugal transfer protein [Paenibacillus urinalis]WDH95156.1 conjugal transfer protein [Paenibacillus urinalis]WDI05372.1 conjugal transfer protein [Paenibacillus urinalis]